MSELTGAAPAWRRVRSQASFETRLILRNGEQLLVTLILPVLLLIGLAQVSMIKLDTAGATRIDFVTPGILALAVMSTAFTSQAITTSFDRRNGVLRLLATTPLGRGGLLAGKVLAVLTVEAVQVVVIGGVALLLGWAPPVAGLAPALAAIVLGTAAFTSLALLLAGMPDQWQGVFLTPAPWPPEFVEAMKKSYLAAGPRFAALTMIPQALELNAFGSGAAQWWETMDRRPALRLMSAGVLVALTIITVWFFLF